MVTTPSRVFLDLATPIATFDRARENKRVQDQRNALSQFLPGALKGDQAALDQLLSTNPQFGAQIAFRQQDRRDRQAARAEARSVRAAAASERAAERTFQRELAVKKFDLQSELTRAQIKKLQRDSTLDNPEKFENMTNPGTGETVAVVKGSPGQKEAAKEGFVLSGAFKPDNKGKFTIKQINDANKVDTAFTAVSQELDNFKRLVQKTGVSVVPGQDKDAIIQARTNIQLQMKELFNLGVLNGPDLELMEKLIFDPSSASAVGSRALGIIGIGEGFESRAVASIDELKKSLKRMRDATAGSVLDREGSDTTVRRRFNPDTGRLE